jgi:hypothetical protein
MPVLRQPAGLSSDTLDRPMLQTRAMHDDQWSAHETVESDDDREIMEETVLPEEDLTIQAGKLSTATDKTHEVETPSPIAPSAAGVQDVQAHEMNAGSAHSLPVVQVTSSSDLSAPMTSRSASSSYPASPTASLTPTTASSLDRRNRHRATMDVSCKVQEF